jgi:hypothetical protein
MSQVQYYDITIDNFHRYENIFEECHNLIYATNAAANPGRSRVPRMTTFDFYGKYANQRLYVMIPRSPSRKLTIYACLILSPDFTITNFTLNPRTNAFETGVGSALFLSILHDMMQGPATQFSQLRILADSYYPFYSFNKQFEFFVGAGFHSISGSVDVIQLQGGASEAYTHSDMSLIRCFSTFHTENMSRIEPQIAISETMRLGLSEFNGRFPIMRPNTSVIFVSDVANKYDAARLTAVLKVFQAIPILPHSSKKPAEYIAFLNHSNYVLNHSKCTNIIRGALVPVAGCSSTHLNPSNIAVFKVPPRVEVVIMNSPGFQTTSASVPICWNFMIKYLNEFTIDELQKIFPPFQSHGEQGIPTDIFNLCNATSGGIMHILDGMYIQIHSYKADNYCPDMSVGINNYGPTNGMNPQTYDFVAPIYGAYKIPKLNEDMKYYDRSARRYMDYKTLLWKTDDYDLFKDLDEKVHAEALTGFNTPEYNGTPDQKLLVAPVKATEYADIAAKVPYYTRLSDVIGYSQTGSDDVVRYYLLSCGSIEDTVQQNIRNALSIFPYIHNSLHVQSNTLADFKHGLDRTGEILYDMFRYAQNPVLSPASPRSPRYLAAEAAAWERARRASANARTPPNIVMASAAEASRSSSRSGRHRSRSRNGRSSSRGRNTQKSKAASAAMNVNS